MDELIKPVVVRPADSTCCCKCCCCKCSKCVSSRRKRHQDDTIRASSAGLAADQAERATASTLSSGASTDTTADAATAAAAGDAAVQVDCQQRGSDQRLRRIYAPAGTGLENQSNDVVERSPLCRVILPRRAVVSSVSRLQMAKQHRWLGSTVLTLGGCRLFVPPQALQGFVPLLNTRSRSQSVTPHQGSLMATADEAQFKAAVSSSSEIFEVAVYVPEEDESN
ncbi:hypothetical protein BOX15_Mlig011469g1 [Macrostomum lignano]|uniref:Uncharacterized protein n=1 Tax=Macrostomum lignano TaxID=282301 RepID=A0A267FST6_9PLAT|nr:hypothetical protein BOX15_Mlig011469g1 [Macrostomum lignano]